VYLINVTYSDSTSHIIYRRYSKFFDLQVGSLKFNSCEFSLGLSSFTLLLYYFFRCHLSIEFNVFLLLGLRKPRLCLNSYFSFFLTFKYALLALHIKNSVFLFPQQWEVRGQLIIWGRKNVI